MRCFGPLILWSLQEQYSQQSAQTMGGDSGTPCRVCTLWRCVSHSRRTRALYLSNLRIVGGMGGEVDDENPRNKRDTEEGKKPALLFDVVKRRNNNSQQARTGRSLKAPHAGQRFPTAKKDRAAEKPERNNPSIHSSTPSENLPDNNTTAPENLVCSLILNLLLFSSSLPPPSAQSHHLERPHPRLSCMLSPGWALSYVVYLIASTNQQ